jgi:hypothetical protein
MHDNVGAAAQVLGDVGINLEQMQDINMDINLADHNNLAVNDEGVDQMEMEVVQNWVPQHPEQPQDTITFDQSGCTANYLRATGPDIHLSVEEILVGAQMLVDTSSSEDSSVVSSVRNANVVVPSFIIKACQNLPFHSLPVLKVWKEDIQKAIVPIYPVMDAILIKLWAALFGDKLVSVQGQAPATSGLGPVSFPTVVSRRPGSKTPLVDTLVHRSSRLNPEAVGGVQVVKIKEPTPKRRKKIVTVIDLENPPKTMAEADGQIPLDVLHEWATSCGVSPSELSEDALMEGHVNDQD